MQTYISRRTSCCLGQPESDKAVEVVRPLRCSRCLRPPQDSLRFQALVAISNIFKEKCSWRPAAGHEPLARGVNGIVPGNEAASRRDPRGRRVNVTSTAGLVSGVRCRGFPYSKCWPSVKFLGFICFRLVPYGWLSKLWSL